MGLKKVNWNSSYKTLSIIKQIAKAINYEILEDGVVITDKKETLFPLNILLNRDLNKEPEPTEIWQLISNHWKSENQIIAYCYNCGGRGRGNWFPNQGICYRCNGTVGHIEKITYPEVLYGEITEKDLLLQTEFTKTVSSFEEKIKDNKDLMAQFQELKWHKHIQSFFSLHDEIYSFLNMEIDSVRKMNSAKTKFNTFIQKYEEAFSKALLALEKEKRRQTELQTKKEKLQFVGEVGAKQKLELFLVNCRTIETNFGYSNLYKFIDKDGNKFTKFGSISDKFFSGFNIFEATEENPCSVSFTAEIKEHSVYRDEKQTILGRVTK